MKAVRAFSTISMVMPVSIPTMSWSYQFFKGLKASTSRSGSRPGGNESHVPRHPHAGLGEKRERPSGGCGDHGAVDRAHGRRAAPDHIALVGVGGGDAPEVVAVIGKGRSQLNTEAAMHIGGDGRIVKVIRELSRLCRKSNQACEY